jgi:uncharacterized protein involved in exopolysaccharide biosynthesis
VRSTVTSYADQRIQVIGQQVMTRSNLLQIVEKYGLYEKRRKTEANEEILERMRKDVKVDVLSADVAGGRKATIAFTLSYSGEFPDQTQKVANELVTLYLNENLKIRQQKAEETASFLASEATRLEDRITELEGRLAEFKRHNMGQLPELAPLNMQLREKAESESADLERSLQLMEQRRFFLESQLSQTDPQQKTLAANGEHVPSPAERLRTLRSTYAGLRGVYSETHPDMVRIRQQVQALEEEVAAAGGAALNRAGGKSAAGEREKVVTKLQAELVALRERYSEDHPDVVRLTRRMEALKSTSDGEGDDKASEEMGNPLYLGIQTQLKVLDSEMVSARARRKEIEVRLQRFEARLVQTPQVEQEYLDLTRERENTLARYHEMRQKQMEAQVAQELEKERKGERFSLIDPPQLPEKPRSPNRPAILLLGTFAAIAGGIGVGGVGEALDRSIKGPKQLFRTLSAPILTVVPHIEIAEERAQRRRRRIFLGFGGAAGLILCLAAVHVLHRPLGVLWFVLLRRLNIGL